MDRNIYMNSDRNENDNENDMIDNEKITHQGRG